MFAPPLLVIVAVLPALSRMRGPPAPAASVQTLVLPVTPSVSEPAEIGALRLIVFAVVIADATVTVEPGALGNGLPPQKLLSSQVTGVFVEVSVHVDAACESAGTETIAVTPEASAAATRRTRRRPPEVARRRFADVTAVLPIPPFGQTCPSMARDIWRIFSILRTLVGPTWFRGAPCEAIDRNGIRLPRGEPLARKCASA